MLRVEVLRVLGCFVAMGPVSCVSKEKIKGLRKVNKSRGEEAYGYGIAGMVFRVSIEVEGKV
jgi:hypothetical protein